MELSNFKVEESTELAVLNEIDLDEGIFLDIVEKITFCLNRLNIKLDGKSVYYQRYANKTSILAIKLANGEDSDVANFMFNGCDASEYAKYMSCDVYLHADKKVSQVSLNIANMITHDIVEFFKTLEGELALKGLSDSELFIRIPLEKDKKVDKNNKDNRLLKLVRNIFKK